MYLFCYVWRAYRYYLFFTAYFLDHYWLDRKANTLAQNPDNIKQDCLYFVKKVGDKHMGSINMYRIDNITFDEIDKDAIKNSPYMENEKYRNLNANVETHKQSKCYKVSYIHLDYFISKKTYLYDYFGME